jgi:carbon monoxide dehydrogenase subunit G
MRIEESLALDVDAAALWPWISTADRLSEWIADVQRFEAKPAGELAVGSLLIVHLPRGTPIQATVERAERGKVLVLRASGLPDGLEVLVTFLVREEEGHAVLTLRAETLLTGIMIFAEKMIASKARAKLASWAEALREAVGRI